MTGTDGADAGEPGHLGVAADGVEVVAERGCGAAAGSRAPAQPSMISVETGTGPIWVAPISRNERGAEPWLPW